ncbi:MAG: DNA polymerase III subunit alpha, partial [Proteobacteria bacterium]|nr:DNA polymerase III subunit alpha [Pseudomonadota bacterium]
MGADVFVSHSDGSGESWEITLLCQNIEGYKNLCILLTKAQKNHNKKGQPSLKVQWLESHNKGLIALGDSMHSDVGSCLSKNKLDDAVDKLIHWKSVFGNRYYIAIAKINRPMESQINDAAIYIAATQQVPMVSSGRVRFLEAEDFNAHEARICINQGHVLADPRRPKNFTREQFFSETDVLKQQFSDYPQMLENSLEIAKRCTLDFNFTDYYLPEFDIPAGETTDSYFSRICTEFLDEFLQSFGPEEGFSQQDYVDRLAIEVGVIVKMGFPGYFLIVADFIKWSKQNDIPVGPGRGSGAGSLVAFVLNITTLDPLKYDLLFERFLNPERISMPDFDVDFCMDRRDEVIAYVAGKYGKEKVSQIITYGSMNAKGVIRDTGRVLGYPYPVVDGIAKLIPNDLGMTLDQALKDSLDLAAQYKTEEETQEIIELAQKLEGIKRNVGKHAGGVVIAPSAITDFCPVYIDQQSMSIVSQFDKDDVESIGLVKFDFLGLRTLTIIDWAVKAVKNDLQIEVDVDRLPLDDKKTFALLKSTLTTAIFQLESSGMQALIGKLKPDAFGDIIALVALYRPGPLDSGMVDTYVKCRHGLERPDYMHSDLVEILEPTYGVILYQEQAMQIAQVLAGFTLGGADILRKAMGKKIVSVMEQQKQVFIDGAIKRGVDEAVAAGIFKQIETFAGYGFNKSHSAAYAMLSYQTAYLKAHYPVHFMAAVLSADMDNTDKIVHLLFDIKKFGINLISPDVNESDYKFKACEGNVVYGLGSIKGVGEAAIDEITQQREKSGKFTSFQDMCGRVNLRKVNKRTLDALIHAGAFDTLHENRRQLIEGMAVVVKASEQQSKDLESGQFDLFASTTGNSSYQSIKLPNVNDYTKLESQLKEKNVLGDFITSHPLENINKWLKKVINTKLADFQMLNNHGTKTRPFTIAVMVLGIRPGFNGKIRCKVINKSGVFELTLKADQ